MDLCLLQKLKGEDASVPEDAPAQDPFLSQPMKGFSPDPVGLNLESQPQQVLSSSGLDSGVAEGDLMAPLITDHKRSAEGEPEDHGLIPKRFATEQGVEDMIS